MNTTISRIIHLMVCLVLLGACGCVSVSGSAGSKTVANPARLLQFRSQDHVSTKGLRTALPLQADAAFGGGQGVAVVSASTAGGENDIHFLRSSDNGTSWAEAKPLHPSMENDAYEDQDPHVATDGQGRWVVVWNAWPIMSDGARGPVEVHVSRSADGGATWSEPARLDEYTALVSDEGIVSPALAADRRGTWMCVGVRPVRSAGNEGQPLDSVSIVASVSTDAGASWSEPRPVDTVAKPEVSGFYHPSVATDGNGAWTVAWSDDVRRTRPNQLLVSSSRDQGATWSTPGVLYAGDGMRVRVAYGVGPAMTAVWEQGHWNGDTWQQEGIAAARSEDGGATWSPAALVVPVSQPDALYRQPRLATDRQGHTMATWEATNVHGGDRDVMIMASSDDGRSWSRPALLNPWATSDRTDDLAPVVGTDGRNRWIALWFSPRGNTTDMFYRINDLARVWWRDVGIGVGIEHTFEL